MLIKAKEYFNQYDAKLFGQEASKEAKNLLLDISEEVKQMAEIRHAKSGKALLSIILEMNNKWNAIVGMYEDKYGVSPLLKNGFKNFWFAEMPELNLIEKGLMH